MLVTSCFVLWVFLPTLFFKPSDTVSFPTLLAGVYHGYLFGWIFAAAAFSKRRSASKTPLYALAAVVGLYFSVTYMLIAYRIYTGHAFDARFAFDGLKDVPAAAFLVFGPATILLPLLFVAAWFGFAWLVLRFADLQKWRLATPPGVGLLILSVGLIEISPGSVSYVGQSMSNALLSGWYYGDIRPIAEAVSLSSDGSSDENVFFLQLESINALAAFGRAVVDRRPYEGEYLPRLEEISAQGVLFRFAWGNTIQTARATEAVLCGVTNNIGAPLTFQPQQIKSRCLPELLRQRNFSTLVF